MLTAVLVLIISALTGIGPSEPSVTASVKSFLLAWEDGDYATAAEMTTGPPVVVAHTLRDTYRQLGAQGLSLAMGGISVHGDVAVARFQASIDLGRGGRPWNYQGRFSLRRQAGGWRVQWSPSVIVPGLGRGDRLAVLTTMPGRAPLQDSGGHPLILNSPSVEVGVRPGRVKNPAVTAARLAQVTGLASSEADQMVGQILAAPPNLFLELVQLAPRKFAHLSAALGRIPGLTHRVVTRRLFRSAVPAITGSVGTEAAKELVEDGEPYRPGTTVGLSGLEQSYQTTLAGTPTTTVVVQNASGGPVKVLKRWPGTRGTPVRTTIDGRVQRAARGSVAGFPYSASVVAIQASTGKILAVAQRQAGGMPAIDPLAGQYQPGQAFTMVTSAAVLSTQPGYDLSKPVPCMRGFSLDGQLFSNVPPVGKLGRGFGKVFAHACSTAFAQLSELLNPGDLETAAQQFGISQPWRLPLRPAAFTGSIARPASQNEQAEEAVGQGDVRVSPLDMALAAGVVDSGSWHQPSIVTGPAGPTLTSGNRVPVKLKTTVIGQLRQMMADTVRSGAAQAAKLPGPSLYGQVGTAPVAGHKGLHAIWFVGFRGNVAFAVLTFSSSASFAPAVQIAHHFAGQLPRS